MAKARRVYVTTSWRIGTCTRAVLAVESVGSRTLHAPPVWMLLQKCIAGCLGRLFAEPSARHRGRGRAGLPLASGASSGSTSRSPGGGSLPGSVAPVTSRNGSSPAATDLVRETDASCSGVMTHVMFGGDDTPDLGPVRSGLRSGPVRSGPVRSGTCWSGPVRLVRETPALGRC